MDFFDYYSIDAILAENQVGFCWILCPKDASSFQKLAENTMQI